MSGTALPPQAAIPGADDIRISHLANGIRLYTRANPTSPAVIVGGFLHAGSLYEPDGQEGLAAFVTSALMRGTRRHNFQEIYTLLEDAGASLSFSSGVHTVSWSGRCLQEDLPMLLGLLAEVLREPVFPSEAVNLLKQQILTGLRLQAQDTETQAAQTFDRLIYGETHPYGRSSSGTPESIIPLTSEDLARFRARQYGPQGMNIILVGAVQHEKALDLLNETLGDWENPTQPEIGEVPPVPPPDRWRQAHVEIPEKAQVDIIIGTTAPPRPHPDFIPLMLANTVLGQFGMMGRIGEAVREQSGLAYYATSNLSANMSTGTWDVSLGVNPENYRRALEVVRAELERFAEEGIPPDELEDVRTSIRNRMPLSLETNAGVMAAILNIARFDLDPDYYRTFDEKIADIDAETVNGAIRRYLNPQALAQASAGTLEGR